MKGIYLLLFIFFLVLVEFTVCGLWERESRNIIFRAKSKYGITLNPIKAAFIHNHTRWGSLDNQFSFVDVILKAPCQLVGQFIINKEESKPKDTWGEKLAKKYGIKNDKTIKF